MKKFKFLTLTLLVLAICMTSVSATAALEVAQPTYDAATNVVTVLAHSEAGAADATIIATRQAAQSNANPTFTEAEVLASIVYIDQIPAAEDMSVRFTPARVAEGDWVSVYMAGAGASGIERKNVEVKAEVGGTYTLNTNGGTLPSGSFAEGEYDEDGISLPAPKKDGYTFVGWYANAEFTGNVFTEIEAGEVGAKEFWAKWTANVTAFVSDAGYTAVSADAVDKEGVISVTATFGSHITDVTEYGFYVYLTGMNKVDGNNISATGNANSFYTVTYGIPADEFDTDVIFLPYVVVAGEYVYGEAEALTVENAVDGEPKYLGTIANLEAQLGIDAE